MNFVEAAGQLLATQLTDSFLRIFVLKLFSCDEPSAFHCCQPLNNMMCCLKLLGNTLNALMQ